MGVTMNDRSRAQAHARATAADQQFLDRHAEVSRRCEAGEIAPGLTAAEFAEKYLGGGA
jgi:hypothetical protein